MKAKLLALGESSAAAAAAARERLQQLPDRLAADATTPPAGPAAAASLDTGTEPAPQAPRDTPDPADEAMISTAIFPAVAAPDAAEQGPVPRQAPGPARPGAASAPDAQAREADELSLWDDYGILDTSRGPVDPDASPSVRLGQLLGASATPTAKVLTFVGVLAVTILLLVLFVSRLMSLDTLVVVETSPTTSATPSAAPETSAAPPASQPPSEEPSTEPAPAAPVTPSMAAGAKECEPGVWAGPQTSCALANEVGKLVPRELTETRVVEAFSPSSSRTYRLECVRDKGITCSGLDGVEGVYVWLVTQS